MLVPLVTCIMIANLNYYLKIAAMWNGIAVVSVYLFIYKLEVVTGTLLSTTTTTTTTTV